MANLTQERLKRFLHYNPDTGMFTWLTNKGQRYLAGKVAGSLRKDGYYKILIDGKEQRAHRLAWLYVFGVWPDKQIDHINCNRSDNRIANLRLATQSENQINSGRQSNNTSGYKGAKPHPNGKWQARLGVNGKRLSLGYYPTAKEAHDAYLAAARKVYGDFARGNDGRE